MLQVQTGLRLASNSHCGGRTSVMKISKPCHPNASVESSIYFHSVVGVNCTKDDVSQVGPQLLLKEYSPPLQRSPTATPRGAAMGYPLCAGERQKCANPIRLILILGGSRSGYSNWKERRLRNNASTARPEGAWQYWAPVPLDESRLQEWIHGRSILVIGDGGSTGSELCRQIARLEPARLVLYGHNEFKLYRMEQEFAQ